MTESRPKSGELKRSGRGPFRDLTPSVPQPSKVFPTYENTPAGDTAFQLDKLQESMGIIQEAINGGYSPYDRLRYFCEVSDHGLHEFHPALLEAIKTIAGYVDTVVAPEAPFDALLWEIRQGNILGKLVQIPNNSEMGDSYEEHIMLGTSLDVRFIVYWRHPWNDEFDTPVVWSSPGEHYPITDDQYQDLKTVVLEKNQEMHDWREAIRAANESPMIQAMLAQERLEADEVIPLPEYNK